MMGRVARRVALPVAALMLALITLAATLATQTPRGPQLAYLSDCNGGENIMLADVRYGVSRPLTCNPSGKSQLTWSPDGRWLAYFNNGQALFTLNLLDADTGEIRAYYFEDRIYANGQQRLSWSPDGTRIALVGITSGGGAQMLFSLDIATSGLTPLTDGQRDATDPQWSPVDASTLIFRQADGLYTLNPDDLNTPPQRVAPRMRHLWTADGAQVGYDYEHPTIRVTRPDATTQELTLPPGFRLDNIAAGPGADELAVIVHDAGGSTMTMNVIDTATGRASPLVRSSSHYMGQPAWSPDGVWIAYVKSELNWGDNIHLYHTGRGQSFALTRGHKRDWSPVWRPSP